MDKTHELIFQTFRVRRQNNFRRNTRPHGRKIQFNSDYRAFQAKIINSFNDYLYNGISSLLISSSPTKKKGQFETIHLTFFVKDKNGQDSGKLIISIPQELLDAKSIQSIEEKFSISDFKKSLVEVNIKVGTTKFPVKELKNLEKEDIVIFENSNVQMMKITYRDWKKISESPPNPGLIITSIDNNNGGHNMEENATQNLWDNIQVDMGAEFDAVKITLGELKNIEQGLVVDISILT